MSSEGSPAVVQTKTLDGRRPTPVLDSDTATVREIEGTTLVTLFENQARRTPDTVAVVDDAHSVTYSALNAEANRLARELIARDAGPETLVGVALHRSLDLIATILGVLKAGAAYLPLDPEYPMERLAFMIADSTPTLVVTRAALLPRLPAVTTTECLEELTDRRHSPRNLQDCERAAPLRPSHPAYVIYTSGSTGKPKGVVGTHIGMVNRLGWLGAVRGHEQPHLAKSSISFLDGSTEWLGPLVHGGTVVIADPITAKTPHLLAMMIQRHGVGAVNVVPSLLATMLEECDPRSFTSCRRWVCSGAALPKGLASRFAATMPDAELLNLYGTSEASGDSVFASCRGDDVAIGTPIWNTYAYVLNDNLTRVPLGTTGELYIAGVGLARGYLKRPAQTATRFVADLHGAPGTRMYRTGDLARWRVDGVLECLGRTDQQVKIRGFRVESGEIEAALRELSGICDAVVIARQEPSGDTRLDAYVLCERGQARKVSGDAIRLQLLERLPGHMVPSAIMVLEEWPLMPNGKVDRTALPRTDGAVQQTQWRPPRTPEEQIMCALIAEVLALPRIGLDDNFFTLGGHSLHAARVAARLSTRYGVNFAVATLLGAASVEQMAGQIRSLRSPARVKLEASGRRAGPVSAAQRPYWTSDQNAAPDRQHHERVDLHLQGELDEDALRNAAFRLVERHQTLRTRYRADPDGRLEQVIDEASHQFRFDVIEHRGAEFESGSAVADRSLAEAESTRGLDLSLGPVARFFLVRLTETDAVFRLLIHHITADEWSFVVYAAELAELYRANIGARHDVLPALPIQYVDYAVFQEKTRATVEFQGHLSYWRDVFRTGIRRMQLGDGNDALTRGDCIAERVLDQKMHELIRAVAVRENCTPAVLLLAALALHLNHRSSEPQPVIGVIASHRQHAEALDLIGLFANIVLVQLDVTAAADGSDLVRRTRTALNSALEHRDVFLHEILRLIPASPDPVGLQVIFSIREMLPAGFLAGPLTATYLLGPASTTGTIPNDIHVNWIVHHGSLQLRMRGNRARFTAAGLERFLDEHIACVQALCANPTGLLSR